MPVTTEHRDRLNGRFAQVTFIQIIEYQTSRLEEVEALGKKFRDESAKATDAAKPLRGTVTADQDRPGYYLSIVEFGSAEAAMEASSNPETQEFFGRLSEFMDGPPKFYNLQVVDTWEME